MRFLPRAAREGRGRDSGWAFTDRVKSRMLETCTSEELGTARGRTTRRPRPHKIYRDARHPSRLLLPHTA
ncbi:hypothetical protein QFW96_13015 [Saccharopolyspora sp. TS4A08]|uniref:Uncharacterized protein n=1 Tax=Saccharopolyspora ipomoeae TaxID=3042027 RepID=A0ABT6PNN3_9PSEU|nr:hypothetical protein [Saccharopolyspora sp. TS4A08]MDI2029544.1 hypothetical protein [Saccharopolyspora sp. TS4A08]